MKTAQIIAYGDIETLTINDIPAPAPEKGDAVVAVVASTINPVDVKHRTPGTPQHLEDFPATLGWDLAGIVLSAPDALPWSPGDRVIAMHPNASWAERVTIPAQRLVAAPATTDLPTAATLPLAGLTALHALRRLGAQAGHRLLVTGATGAVGGLALQLARDNGIETHALVSRPERLQDALDLGAHHASSDVDEAEGFDLVLDTAGILDHPHVLREGGRLVTVSDDPIPPSLHERAATAVTNYVAHDPSGLDRLARMVEAGDLTLRLAAGYPLTDIRSAHRHHEAGGLNGKVVLTM